MNKNILIILMLFSILSCNKNDSAEDDVIIPNPDKAELLNMIRNTIWISRTGKPGEYSFRAIAISNVSSELYTLDDNYKILEEIESLPFAYQYKNYALIVGHYCFVTSDYILYESEKFYKSEKRISDLVFKD